MVEYSWAGRYLIEAVTYKCKVFAQFLYSYFQDQKIILLARSIFLKVNIVSFNRDPVSYPPCD